MGLIHCYYGDGKGKTTAALGLALRAQGAGFHVVLAQFLKTMPTGELHALALLPRVTVLRGTHAFGFTWTLSDTDRMTLRDEQNALFLRAVEACSQENRTLLILDEAISADTYGYLDPALLRTYVSALPEHVELVLTGRDPAEDLLKLADYATEMRKIRHPFDRGVSARDGIEQ